jgi:hypothetical protein
MQEPARVVPAESYDFLWKFLSGGGGLAANIWFEVGLSSY